MADANSAYTLADAPRLKCLDEFNLMMIEQPLAHDEIIDHAKLQAQLQTPICLDECIRSAHQAEQAIAMKAGRIINIKLGPRGRIRGSQAGARCRASGRHPGVVRRHARIRHRPRAQYRALHACRISRCPATFRPASAIGRATSSSRRWKYSTQGTIAVRDEPGFGYELDRDFLDSITVRQESSLDVRVSSNCCKPTATIATPGPARWSAKSAITSTTSPSSAWRSRTRAPGWWSRESCFRARFRP